tara:strand:+ start:86 stop:760 length:675 start_codon:yes stop_codon:yes gene_type:complete
MSYQHLSKDDIVKEINTTGYYVLENYLSIEQCSQVISHFKGMIANNIQCGRGEGNDIRIASYHKYSKIANDFLNDQFIIDIGTRCFGYPVNELSQRCQACYLKYEKNKHNCSGGGWHVDCHNRQFKALLYLTDVTENNGAFKIIEKSRKSHKNVPSCDELGKNRDTRYILNDLENYYPKEQFTLLPAKAGTCIIADVSNIHRGTIIKSDERIILMNYYYCRGLQ